MNKEPEEVQWSCSKHPREEEHKDKAVLEKTLESPWTVRSNQCILQETSPECSLEGE